MARLHSLGYVGFQTPRIDEWEPLASEIIGFETSPQVDGSLRIRWDDRAYRLQLHPGPDDRIAYIGWEIRDQQELRSFVDHLRSHGISVAEGSEELARERSVQQLATFTDPYGLPLEVFTGQTYLDRTFRGRRATTGFITGAQGAGHIVVVVPSLEGAYAFYRDILGFRVTDVVDTGFGVMSFLRLNPRHHSLALWEMPGAPDGLIGLQHLMVEAHDFDDVGRAYDLVEASDYELSSTMGRHAGDEQMSFYVRTPSGFDLEYGADSLVVEDENSWTVRYYNKSAGAKNEIWGHHFRPLAPQTSIRPFHPAADGESEQTPVSAIQ
ncbi:MULTISPECIES: VOC family protein [Nocardia]|uniref:VOC family protein n=1 Tax=Nocardia vinacea TaxID=96468 RepID=A0ABZ1YNY6_9NOCA|nr:VOC family protein [Nocardia vinacea]